MDASADCKQYFGYLGERSKEEQIPEYCMTCSKLLSCMLINIRSPRSKLEEDRRRYYRQAGFDIQNLGGRHQKLNPLENLLKW